MKVRILLASLLLASFATRDVAAQSCLDQNAPTFNACMAGFGQVDLAQSFIQTATDITGAGVYFDVYGSPETVTISLWDNLPNAGGIQLASGTGTASPSSWLDVSWPAVSVTPGATYYLVFSTTITLCYGGDVFDGYPNGMVFANPGFNAFPGYDYTFRTYNSCGSSPTLAKVGTCPGPVTLNVTNCTPGGNVAVIHGQAGASVRSGNPCNGMVLGILNPSFGGMLTANGSGSASLSFNAPAGACGRSVQAVDVASCTPTNVIVL